MLPSTSYGAIAEAYARHWGPSSATMMLPVLQSLLLPHLASGAAILDLCCGTGDVAERLEALGYGVTGVDGTTELVELALKRGGRARFEVSEAQRFRREASFDAITCLYDSLNHLASIEELGAVFSNCHASLKQGGWFLFDLNEEAGFEARWRGEFSIIEPDLVVVARSKYSRVAREGRMTITQFRASGQSWQRSDVQFQELCFPRGEVLRQLELAGFSGVEVHSAESDLGLSREVGRAFFRCRRTG